MFNVAQRRYLSTPSHINHLTVIGAGLMGAGIVQVAAVAGYKVTMVSTISFRSTPMRKQ